MKKNLIVLLVIALVSVGLFAADPPAAPTATDSFTVQTNVLGVNEMQVTEGDIGTATTWTGATTYQGYGISNENPILAPTAPIAYLSVISNRRAGYTISLTVAAMKSTVGSVDSYINYDIKLNNTTVSTNNGTAVTKDEIIVVQSLTGLTGISYPINLTVNATQFAAAVEGDYTGTVTFNYTAR
jgi:hypothetical protein